MKCKMCEEDDHIAHDTSVYLLGCQNEDCDCITEEELKKIIKWHKQAHARIAVEHTQEGPFGSYSVGYCRRCGLATTSWQNEPNCSITVL